MQQETLYCSDILDPAIQPLFKSDREQRCLQKSMSYGGRAKQNDKRKFNT